MEQIQTASKRNIRRRTLDSDKKKVVILNDDVTTFEFVTRMLVEIFFYEEADAEALTEKVDREGSAVVGVYPKDIAESKAQAGMDMARAENFPLKLITENA
ncbi:MAG: ATP-dependent Clp protease adaptor ClpS [Marinilabiliaceae bacterium]